MDPSERNRRRRAFGGDSRTFHRLHLGYPEEAWDRVFAYHRDSAPQEILEIGAGTGQATRALLDRGHHVLALEPEADLAEVLVGELAGRDLAFIPLTFEGYVLTLPRGRFHDMVVATTAAPWTDPEGQASRLGRVLRTGGTLALLTHTHPGPREGFFERVQSLYRHHVPELDPDSPSSDSPLETRVKELQGTSLFQDAVEATFDHHRDYSAEEYVSLLRTFSDHVLLGSRRLDPFLDDVRQLIEREYAGHVLEHHRTHLVLARRSPLA